MSHEAVQAVLERTVSDDAFRAQLFTQPEEALAAYDLEDAEVDALRALAVEQSDTDATALDQRQSKGQIPFWLL